MEINVIDEQVSISGQIMPSDIVHLVEMKVEVIVCNRPDGESDDQPSYKAVELEAVKQGITIVNIPFAGGQMQPDQVQEFADILTAGQRIHAYCRTGRRSSTLWAAAKAL